jgi:hypothetical protein
MYTTKYLDYLDWKSLIELKRKNVHKTTEGKNYMIDIKQKMNRGRILSNNIIYPIDQLKIVRWFNEKKWKINVWAVCDESRTYGS